MEHYSLKSNWEKTGTDYQKFKNVVNEVVESTYVETLETSELQCLNIVSMEENGKLSFKCATDPYARSLNNYTFKPEQAKELEDIKEEVMTNRMIIGKISNSSIIPLFVDEHALITLGQKIGLSGDWFFNPGKDTSLFVRNAAVFQALSEKKRIYKLAYRQVGSIKKLFACFSEKYAELSQNDMIRAIEYVISNNTLGKMKCDYWEIDQFFTKIVFSFPDYAKDLSTIYGLERTLIPCLTFMTSDTGDCSLKVITTWKAGTNSYSTLDEFEQKHIGDADIKSMKDDIENHIFPEYTKIPEKLVELMSINITDPGKDYIENKKIYVECIKKVMKSLGFVKAIGKKNDKILFDSLCAEYNSMINYTAYDICMSIMELPERINGLDRIKSDNLSKICGQAPFSNAYTANNTTVFLEA